MYYKIIKTKLYYENTIFFKNYKNFYCGDQLKAIELQIKKYHLMKIWKFKLLIPSFNTIVIHGKVWWRSFQLITPSLYICSEMDQIIHQRKELKEQLNPLYKKLFGL